MGFQRYDVSWAGCKPRSSGLQALPGNLFSVMQQYAGCLPTLFFLPSNSGSSDIGVVLRLAFAGVQLPRIGLFFSWLLALGFPCFRQRLPTRFLMFFLYFRLLGHTSPGRTRCDCWFCGPALAYLLFRVLVPRESGRISRSGLRHIVEPNLRRK